MNSLLRIFFGTSKDEKQHTQVTRAAAQMEALHTLSRNLDNAFAHPEQTHELVASSALILSGAQNCLLLTPNNTDGTLQVEAAAGVMDATISKIGSQKSNIGLLGQVMLTAQPMFCDSQNPFRHEDPLLIPLDTSNLIAIPLRIASEEFGVLVIDSRLDRRAYTSSDIKILELFANFSAVVEHGAGIIAKVKRQTDRLKAVFKVSRFLSDIREDQELFDLVVFKAVELTGAVTGSLVLYDQERGKLRIQAFVGLSDNQASLELDAGEGITGWVFQNGTGLLADDVSIDNRYVSLSASIRSEVAVPIKDAHSVIGVLNVDHTDTNAFTSDDLELLQALADVASGAIRAERK